MKQYALGFAFDPLGTLVLLINKLRPEWQKGHLNGIGGGIEEGETPVQAMVREFFEETGIRTQESDWTQFCTLNNAESECFVFKAFLTLETIASAKQTTDEVPIVCVPHRLPEMALPNLSWLIPLARSNEECHVVASYRAKNSRRVERLNTDPERIARCGTWEHVSMLDLRKGDEFRMFEADGQTPVKDADGTSVWIADSDGYETKGVHGVKIETTN